MSIVEEVLGPSVPSDRNDTTAERIVSALTKRGIHRDEIRPQHLDFIYSMRKHVGGPDFRILEQLQLAGNSRPHESTDLLGVIIESRPHPALEFVVSNFVDIAKAPVQLFHGPSSTKYIKSTRIGELVSDGQVSLTSLGVDLLDSRGYNALLMSRKFWNSVHATRKLVIFQTDSILCSESDYSVADFMHYDYIGSKWNRSRPVGIVMDGGNGGLSLRDKRAALECLDRFPPHSWTGGEDGYFAFHLDLLGARIGRDDSCAKFSTQHEFLCKSFGAHKLEKLTESERQRFFEYCPDAKQIS